MSINGQKVIAAIREVAAERPRHVHGETCQYVARTADGYVPGCLVGHGLCRARLITNLRRFRRDVNANAAPIDSSVLLRYNWGFDPDEMDWLVAVQDAQDKRHTWGNCPRIADKLMPLKPASMPEQPVRLYPGDPMLKPIALKHIPYLDGDWLRFYGTEPGTFKSTTRLTGMTRLTNETREMVMVPQQTDWQLSDTRGKPDTFAGPPLECK